MAEIISGRRRPRRRPSPRAIEIFRRHQIQGLTQREVAKAMGCSAPRVHQICRYVTSWLNEQPAEANIPAIRHRHDLLINSMVAEALTAWDRSKEPSKTTKAKMVRGRASQAGVTLADLVTSEQTERGQCGDPRYLQMADQLLRSQRGMWGADEPKRSEVSGPDGGPITLATLLKVIGDNPPPIPELEQKPTNVLDLDDALREIDAMSVGGGEVVDVESREPEAE